MYKLGTLFIAPLIIIMIFIESGCLNLPTNPIMPQWNVDLNIPIVNRSYNLNDIVKKQNYISVKDPNTADNIFLIQSDNYSQSVGVSQFIKATGTETVHSTVTNSSGAATLYVQFPDNAVITNAVFSSGIFSYKFSNISNQNVIITLTIPGITKSGAVFSEQVHLAPLAVDTNYFDFSGAAYNLPANQPSIFKNSLQVVITINAALPAAVDMDLYTQDFFFSSATGLLQSKSLGTKSDAFGLNIKTAQDYRDKVTLKDANLSLDASYYSPANNPFPIEVQNLSIMGKRNDGSQFALTIPDSAKTFIFTNGVKHFNFDASNSNITKFISFLPDSVIVTAEYIMNPNNTTGTVTSQDSVKFAANFSTTSFMAISNASITDTSGIQNISDKDRTKIKAAQSAYLSVNIQNGIPLQASVIVNIADSAYKTLFTLKNNTDNTNTFSISPASVDANGNVLSQTSTSFTVQLDSTQTDELSHGYYAIYTISVETPNNPTPVALRPSDLVKIQIYGGVKFQVNEDNLK